MEHAFTVTRQVEERAALGYSRRRPTRAAEAVTGMPPKRRIGERVVLKTEREPAHAR
ncbi:hypothetical protein ACIRFH_28060 [Streptomyces sp. NPDC093586]|uniref:hypothetical protein n=1 Tax=Streptomyces sp. NPDC093586 TaxID=3366042 RepID=UPI003819699C